MQNFHVISTREAKKDKKRQKTRSFNYSYLMKEIHPRNQKIIIMSDEVTLLFVSDKDDQTQQLKNIKGVDEKGNLQTNPIENEVDQTQFFKVDKSLNPLENFFKNFWTQFKNPDKYKYYRFNEDEIDKAKKIGKKELKKHDITSEVDQKIKSIKITLDPSKIDWKTLEKFGITEESLKKDGSLESMLKGYGSKQLIDIKFELNGVTFEGKARAFFNSDENKITTNLKSKLDYPNFNSYDVSFTDDDKKMMFKTGNLGRVVMHKFKGSQEAEPAFLSLDSLTNRIVALKASSLKIKDEYRGAKISEEQKNSLEGGNAVYLTGIKDKNGIVYDGYVQISAETRGLAPVRDRARQQQKNEKVTQENVDPLKSIPKQFGGQSITEEQRIILKDNGAIYVPNVMCKDQKVRDSYFLGTPTGVKYYDAADPKNASLAQKVLESQKKYQEKYQSTSTNPDTTNKNSQEQENAEKNNKSRTINR